MASAIPPQLKLVKPILMRAVEMDKAPVPNADIIAYCCRRHAMRKIIGSEAKSDPSVAQYLAELMDKLETDNSTLKAKYEDDFSKDAQSRIVAEFANSSFKGLEAVYKSGKATKSTARSFIAMSAFFDVAGLEKHRVMCKFIGKEILEAIREGRTPGPPVAEEVEPEEFNEDAVLSATPNEPGNDPYAFDSGLPALNELSLDETSPPPKNNPAPATVLDDDEGFAPPKLGQIPINAQLSARGIEFMKQVAPSSSFTPARDMESLEAQGYARKAVDLVKNNHYAKAIDQICEALKRLEHKKPYAVINASGLKEETKLDMIEYLLFAARTLECAGALMPVPQAKARAITLLHDALRVAQSG